MKIYNKTYFEILFIIGLLLSILVTFDRTLHFLPDFIRGMFSSMSILFIVAAGIVKNSKKIQEKLQISSNDERILAIQGKASSITLYLLMTINVVCIIIFGFIGEPYLLVSLILAFIMLAAILILLFTKLVLSKRM